MMGGVGGVGVRVLHGREGLQVLLKYFIESRGNRMVA